MELNHDAIDAQLASLLRNQPRGTTANLADFAVAYWNGLRVVYVFLHEDGHAALDEDFDLTDYLLDQWEADIAAWFAEPHYSVRPELLKWLKADAQRGHLKPSSDGGLMKTTDLPNATLDCWVERAERLRLNPHASIADVVNDSHCQKFTSDLDLARPIIEREQIVVEEVDDAYRGVQFFAYRPYAGPVSLFVDGRMWHGDTYLDAAMLCYVVSVFGEEAEFMMLWENGETRYEPYE